MNDAVSYYGLLPEAAKIAEVSLAVKLTLAELRRPIDAAAVERFRLCHVRGPFAR